MLVHQADLAMMPVPQDGGSGTPPRYSLYHKAPGGRSCASDAAGTPILGRRILASATLCKMLQDAVQAFAVAALDRHAAMVPELAQGGKAALPTHAREACAAERLPLPPGGMGAMRVRGPSMPSQECVNSCVS